MNRIDQGFNGAFGFVLLLMVALATSTLQAAEREWSAVGRNETISIADCADCDEDIGMMVECKGPGLAANVTVNWAAVENGEEGAVLPISLTVDNHTFTYQATTVQYGLIGYTPQFALSPGDPVIEAMQGGRTVVVRFSGSDTEISLKGSRRSFDLFKSNCGW